MADGISAKDLAYRALASAIGGPVDLTTMLMRPLGYDVEKPVLGSEWIGQKMQDSGLVSEARDPLKEFAASVMVPSPGGLAAGVGKGAALLPAIAGMTKAGKVEDALGVLKMPPNIRTVIKDFSTAFEREIAADPELHSAVTKYIYGGPQGFKAIQKELRSGGTSEIASIMEKKMKPLSSFSDVYKGGPIYRGLTGQAPIKNGAYHEKGLMSTTTNPYEAAEFATQNNRGTPTVLRITPKPSTKATIGAPGQAEFVLAPGQTAKLTGGREITEHNGREVIVLDAVLD
jgi:hypothetical protein